MFRLFSVTCLFTLVSVFSGCATLSPYVETPAVTVTSFGMAPDGAASGPIFRVGLRVTNPNRIELPLVGMSYRVDIQGQRVLTGATSNLPVVPAYGSADFSVDLAPDLIGSLRLISELMAQPSDVLRYRYTASLDVGGWRPNIRVEESGEFSGFAAGARR